MLSEEVIYSKLQCLNMFNSLIIRSLYRPDIFGGESVVSEFEKFSNALLKGNYTNLDTVNQKFGVNLESSNKIKSRMEGIVRLCIQILYKMQFVDTNTDYLSIFNKLLHSDSEYVCALSKIYIKKSSKENKESFLENIFAISIEMDPVLQLYIINNVVDDPNSIENDDHKPRKIRDRLFLDKDERRKN